MTTHQLHGGPQTLVVCDECGRRSDDPDWDRELIGYLSYQQMAFDICNVCMSMKLGHILRELKRRLEKTPR